MANQNATQGPPNGGFLASWGASDDWGSSGSDSGGGGSGQGGGFGQGQDRRHAVPGFDFGSPSAFQTAGGAGGGFVNYASWLLANPENVGNKYLQGSPADTGHISTHQEGEGEMSPDDVGHGWRTPGARPANTHNPSDWEGR